VAGSAIVAVDMADLRAGENASGILLVGMDGTTGAADTLLGDVNGR
jgi:hypothetical protein